MKRQIIHLLLFCAGVSFSYAQDVVLWKHVLRFSNDRYLPKGYIESKYCYRDTTLLYEMDYSDNGWQIYDSISYNRDHGLWYISSFYSDTNLQLYLRFRDTAETLFRTNSDIHYTPDKYHIISRYLNGINDIISTCRADSSVSIYYWGDTCCYSFVDVDYPLLFSGYGVPANEPLKRYYCHIGVQGNSDWDRFCFSSYTITRRFEYDTLGNLCKVTIKKEHDEMKKTIWVESYFLVEE